MLPIPVDFDAEEMGVLVAEAKRRMRARMKGLRGALPASAIADRSARVVAALTELPIIERARAVALFWPIAKRNEVDLRPFDALLRARGVRLYYPFMTPNDGGFTTGFRLLDDPARLEQKGRGFHEPPADAPLAVRGDIDVVVVPALAASADGHRVGYGIGFYDVTLPDVCPPAQSVIVAFSFQLLSELPHHEGDFACDLVVTDERVSDARPARGPA